MALAVITLAVGFGTPAIAAGTASAAVTPVIWTSVTAKSTGTLWTNNCFPNCAQGKTGRIQASELRRPQVGPGQLPEALATLLVGPGAQLLGAPGVLHDR